jgi:uncharacterized protein (DUF983 family)
MSTPKEIKKHGYLWGIYNHKCPQCREGNMFQDKGSYKLKSFMKMNEYCPACGQRMEIETGFYYGTGYVSYVLAVALSVASFVAWFVIIGMSLKDSRFFWWMGFNAIILILLQPYLMRLSRTLWLSFFVKYNVGWRVEKLDTGNN